VDHEVVLALCEETLPVDAMSGLPAEPARHGFTWIRLVQVR
jgi:hypothetical protein